MRFSANGSDNALDHVAVHLDGAFVKEELQTVRKRDLGDNSGVFGPFDHIEDAGEGSDGSELFVLSEVWIVLESIHALGAEDHDLLFGGDVRADGLNDDCLDEHLLGLDLACDDFEVVFDILDLAHGP